jgi:exodeoxyribonuclease V alpha subunit
MKTYLGPVVSLNFYNEDTGYAILRMKVSENNASKFISVKGIFHKAKTSVGQFLKVVGKENDEGDLLASAIYPPSLEKVRDHLQDLFCGHPYKPLNRMVLHALEETFGSDWKDHLLKDKDAFMKSGLDKPIAERATRTWKSAVTRLRPYAILRNLGFSHRQSMSSIDSLGSHAELLFFKDPYLLGMIGGIGFNKADEVARDLGVSDRSKERLRKLIANELDRSESRGNTILRLESISRKLGPIFEIDHANLKQFIKEDPLIDYRLYKLDGPGDFISRPSSIHVARVITNRLVTLSQGGAKNKGPLPPSVSDFDLDAEQKLAIKTCVRNPVSVITGGPGTGKTTIIKEVAAALRHFNGDEMILYSALAGKAARRMQQSTGEQASTLHAMLGMRPGKPPKFHAKNKLEVDTLVLDEASMVDEAMFSDVLNALPDSARLILVGDVGQLPSIGPGAIMRDLIESDAIPCVKLRKSNRFAADSDIGKAAVKIMNKKCPDLRPDGNLRWADMESGSDIAGAIAKEASDAVKRGVPVDDIQCLSPQLGTETGADALSMRLKPILNPGAFKKPSIERFGREFHLDDRIMQTGKNDYELNLFNGDVGKIIKIDYRGSGGNEEPSITMSVDDERGEIVIPIDKMGSLRLAYSMTVHKSQGSEYPFLLMPIARENKNMIDQQLLNTAITRCKNELFMAGNREVLAAGAKNTRSSRRDTVLKAAIQKSFTKRLSNEPDQGQAIR